MSNYSSEDSLILSNVEAINDNVRRKLEVFENQVFRLQAMADADPRLDYANTDTEFEVSVSDLEDLRQKAYENKFSLRRSLDEAEKQVLCHGEYGSSYEARTEIRDSRNCLNERMRRLEDVLSEVSGNLDYSELYAQDADALV